MFFRQKPRRPVGVFCFSSRHRAVGRGSRSAPAPRPHLRVPAFGPGFIDGMRQQMIAPRALLIPAIVLLACASSCGGGAAPPMTASGARGAGATAPAVRRIVSLAPNVTEMLFALGLGGRVVGVTEFCNYPPEALRIPKVGGYINPNAEAILALRPDLVIATPNAGNRALVERVMAVGARVEVVQARNIAEIVPAIEAIAKAAGVEADGRHLAAEMRRSLDRQTARVDRLPRPRVLFCLQIEPLVVAGRGSYPSDLVELAGGENVVPASAGAYPTLSLESVIAAAPDIIVQSLMDSGGGPTGADALLAYWRRFPSIPAVATERIHMVPGDLVLRPGPRVAEGAGALINLIHPDAPGGAAPPDDRPSATIDGSAPPPPDSGAAAPPHAGTGEPLCRERVGA